MSLNHILETAGRLGIPVVITNDRGESPQVVMPFEDFAAMAGVPGASVKKSRAAQAIQPEDEVAEALADLTRERIHKQMEGTDQTFLEEKFYLEPVDEGQTG